MADDLADAFIQIPRIGDWIRIKNRDQRLMCKVQAVVWNYEVAVKGVGLVKNFRHVEVHLRRPRPPAEIGNIDEPTGYEYGALWNE